MFNYCSIHVWVYNIYIYTPHKGSRDNRTAENSRPSDHRVTCPKWLTHLRGIDANAWWDHASANASGGNDQGQLPAYRYCNSGPEGYTPITRSRSTVSWQSGWQVSNGDHGADLEGQMDGKARTKSQKEVSPKTQRVSRPTIRRLHHRPQLRLPGLSSRRRNNSWRQLSRSS